jgi:Outer membrane protein beta-barrel domain
VLAKCIMKIILSVLFTVLWLSSPAQHWRWGLRGGASFSNFILHNASSNEIPAGPTFSTQPILNFQPPISPRPRFGLELPSVALTNSDFYEVNFFADQRTGFYSGIYFDREWTKKWNMEIGLNYCQKGLNMKYEFKENTASSNNTITKLSYEFNRKIHLDYLTIPFVFRYKLEKSGRFYVSGGTYHAIAINFKIINSTSIVDREVVSSSGQPVTLSKETHTVTNAYADLFDSGLIGGFGMDWPMRNWKVGIDFRGSVGLTRVPKKYDDVGFLSFGPNTRNINFEIGLKVLRSGKKPV